HTLNIPYQLVAFDDRQQKHLAHNVNVTNTGEGAVSGYNFDLPPEKMARIEFQVRELDRQVDATNLSLRSGKLTQPKITVSEVRPGQ
ncbi:MAG: hypothetical protein ACREJC_07080, partial [Tepidisphaeraceae bacterium]